MTFRLYVMLNMNATVLKFSFNGDFHTSGEFYRLFDYGTKFLISCCPYAVNAI